MAGVEILVNARNNHIKREKNGLPCIGFGTVMKYLWK